MFLQGGKGLEDLGMRFAAAYGLKFVATDDGEQMHGVVTFLIDPRGKLRARYHGLNFNSVNLTLHAAALVHDIHNRDDENSLNNAQILPGSRSTGYFVVLASLGILICMAIFYCWKWYHKRHSPPVNNPVHPTKTSVR